MHTLSPETKERLYLHIYAREHTKTCMCVQMYVYIYDGVHLSPLLRVHSCLSAHWNPLLHVCVHVCLMEVDFVVSLGDSEDCHQYCTFFSSELSNVSTCVYVCVCVCGCKTMSVWGLYRQPQFDKGSVRLACMLSTSSNKSQIVTGGSCLCHDNSFNNVEPWVLIRRNE